MCTSCVLSRPNIFCSTVARSLFHGLDLCFFVPFFCFFFLSPPLLHPCHQPERLKHCFYRTKKKCVTSLQNRPVTYLLQHKYLSIPTNINDVTENSVRMRQYGHCAVLWKLMLLDTTSPMYKQGRISFCTVLTRVLESDRERLKKKKTWK